MRKNSQRRIVEVTRERGINWDTVWGEVQQNALYSLYIWEEKCLDFGRGEIAVVHFLKQGSQKHSIQ